MLEDRDTVTQMTTALGEAVVACWARCPQDVQHMLFEAAVRDDTSFRGALALFLHDHNPRTADAVTTDSPAGEEEELPPHFPSGRPQNPPRQS